MGSGNGDFGESQFWMRQNYKKYVGQWVALIGGTLIDNDFSRLELQKRLNFNPSHRDILVWFVAKDIK